jgi:hypothetical protein
MNAKIRPEGSRAYRMSVSLDIGRETRRCNGTDFHAESSSPSVPESSAGLQSAIVLAAGETEV